MIYKSVITFGCDLFIKPSIRINMTLLEKMFSFTRSAKYLNFLTVCLLINVLSYNTNVSVIIKKLYWQCWLLHTFTELYRKTSITICNKHKKNKNYICSIMLTAVREADIVNIDVTLGVSCCLELDVWFFHPRCLNVCTIIVKSINKYLFITNRLIFWVYYFYKILVHPIIYKYFALFWKQGCCTSDGMLLFLITQILLPENQVLYFV